MLTLLTGLVPGGSWRSATGVYYYGFRPPCPAAPTALTAIAIAIAVPSARGQSAKDTSPQELLESLRYPRYEMTHHPLPPGRSQFLEPERT